MPVELTIDYSAESVKSVESALYNEVSWSMINVFQRLQGQTQRTFFILRVETTDFTELVEAL